MDQPTESPSASPPTVSRLSLTEVPIGLVAGVGLMFVLGTVVDVASTIATADGNWDALPRWNLIAVGNTFALLALLITGAVDLVRRTAGRSRLGAQIVLAAVIARLALALVQQYVSSSYIGGSHHDAETIQTAFLWMRRLGGLTWLAFDIGLIVAGWRVRAVRMLAGPLIVAGLLAHPFDFYARWLYSGLADSRYAWLVIEAVLTGAWAGLAIAVIWKGAFGAVAAGWERTSRAIDRTASALYARLWIALSSALLVVMSFGGGGGGGGGEGLGKLFAVGVPVANALAGCFLVAGVLGASGLSAPGAPRLRLLLGGAALVWTVAIQSLQVFILFRVVVLRSDSYSGASEIVRALPLLIPLVGMAGLLLLVDGLRRFGSLLGSAELVDGAKITAGIVITTQLIAVGVGYWSTSARDITPEMAIGLLLLLIGVGIATLLVVARQCRQVAAALRSRTDVPTAMVLGP